MQPTCMDIWHICFGTPQLRGKAAIYKGFRDFSAAYSLKG
jgi:hypothetical protein